jgi:hypothetical protein
MESAISFMNQLTSTIIRSDTVKGIADPTFIFPTPSTETAHLIPFGAYYNALNNWKFPVLFSMTYYIIVSIWKNSLSPESKNKKTSLVFTAFVFAHNVFLCLFSCATFLNTFQRFILNFQTRPFLAAYCDLDGSFWFSGLGYWAWLFYLSKYYEVIDTLILLLKGRKPSFLQSYHHAGAILAMWVGYSFF